jgi:hypothetical protein
MTEQAAVTTAVVDFIGSATFELCLPRIWFLLTTLTLPSSADSVR